MLSKLQADVTHSETVSTSISDNVLYLLIPLVLQRTIKIQIISNV